MTDQPDTTAYTMTLNKLDDGHAQFACWVTPFEQFFLVIPRTKWEKDDRPHEIVITM